MNSPFAGFCFSLYAAILTESRKSPASIAKSNKQWVGTCLSQEFAVAFVTAV